MRGYRSLKIAGRVESISIIQRELTDLDRNIDEQFFPHVSLDLDLGLEN